MRLQTALSQLKNFGRQPPSCHAVEQAHQSKLQPTKTKAAAMLLTAAFDSSFDKSRMLKSKNLLAINNLPNIFGGNGGIRTLDEALHPILP